MALEINGGRNIPTKVDAQLAYAKSVASRLTPRWTKYIAQTPFPKQHLALCLDHVEEIFFGGSAGPGKSSWLLMSALQYVDEADYAALIVRRNYNELSQPGGLISRAEEWLGGTDARWDSQNKAWHFPSGATLVFGHMDDKAALRRYKGGNYHFIGFDELTDFEEHEFRFLFSRLRRAAGSKIPIRMRAASNPGGLGHMWVKNRFIDSRAADRVFIPASLNDNPAIDRATYIKSLSHLDPVTQARLLNGDWEVTDGGVIFNRLWFKNQIIPAITAQVSCRVRAWDLAATTNGKRTAGVKMCRTVDGRYIIEDVVKGQWTPGIRDEQIKFTAELDGQEDCAVAFEEEPASGGKAQNETLIRMLAGWRTESVKLKGDKFIKAGPLASQCQVGNVSLIKGLWNSDFIEELHCAQEEAAFLDQMDAAALAFHWLTSKTRGLGPVETPVVEKHKRGSFDDDMPDETEKAPDKYGFLRDIYPDEPMN